MSTTTELEGRKYINGILAVGAIILAYITNSFLHQMGIWLELEAKVSKFQWMADGFSVIVGAVFFLYMYKHEQVKQYLHEVYVELTKVVWSDRDSTIKLTIGIVIALIIIGVVLGLVDYLINNILNLLYSYFGL